jgi:hypothetical protein
LAVIVLDKDFMTRLLFSLLILMTTSSVAQVSPNGLKFPKLEKLPESFQKVIDNKIKEYHRLFERDSSKTNHYTVSFILDKIDTDSNYHYLFLAEFWSALHYKDMIPALIGRVTNKREIGLVNSADLIIMERIQTKQMTFYGHGGVSSDDLFTIAGRANRILTQITGENFGNVSMYSTPQQLETLQRKWTKWLKKL